MESVPGAVATGAQASSLAITRRRDNTATGTVALQSYPVANAPGTDLSIYSFTITGSIASPCLPVASCLRFPSALIACSVDMMPETRILNSSAFVAL